VSWFRNPTWERESILQLDAPIHADVGDVDGDGRVDLVITSGFHGFNPTSPQPNPTPATHTGSIDWVSNPEPGVWKTMHIGELELAHQSFIGDFAGNGNFQVLSVSIGNSTDVAANMSSFVLFVPPDDPSSPSSSPWFRVNLTSFVIPAFHNVYHAEKVPKSNGAKGVNLLVTGKEGILLLEISQQENQWKASSTLLYTTSSFGATDITTIAIGTHPYFIAAIDSEPLSNLNPLQPWHGKKKTNRSTSDTRCT